MFGKSIIFLRQQMAKLGAHERCCTCPASSPSIAPKRGRVSSLFADKLDVRNTLVDKACIFHAVTSNRHKLGDVGPIFLVFCCRSGHYHG